MDKLCHILAALHILNIVTSTLLEVSEHYLRKCSSHGPLSRIIYYCYYYVVILLVGAESYSLTNTNQLIFCYFFLQLAPLISS